MNRRLSYTLFALGLALPGCHKNHLQYDYGRAFNQAMITQADLNRPSVADSAYPLTGTEGVALRMRVTEVTTDAESGQAESTRKVDVQ